MTRLLDEVDVCAMLRNACRAAGGQRSWARAHGVSEQYVSDVVGGRKKPGESITTALGLVRVERYVHATRRAVSADRLSLGVASSP
jgi:hypothetical protein